MTHSTNPHAPVGAVIHSAAAYDFFVWFMTLGREHELRQSMLRFARLRSGESVLDVGCGTGNIPIAAKQQVGPKGVVYGIDPSPEMLARAERKAHKGGAEIVFRNAAAQELP